MQIHLSPETEKFIQQELETGRFASADDLLEEAVACLRLEGGIEEVDARELDDETVAAINRAEEQFARGEGIDFDVAVAEIRKMTGRS